MKQHINEIKRMQKLAGIITESTIYEVDNLYEGAQVTDDEIAKAISDVTKGAIPPDAINVDKLEKDPDSPDAIDKSKIKTPTKSPGKEELKEVGLVTTLILLAPTIANLIGKKINSIKEKNLTTYSTPAQIEKSKELEKELQKLKAEKDRLDKENKHEEENAVVEKIKELEHEKEKLTGFAAGNAMIKLGHKLHEMYVFPIKAILDGYAWYQRVWNKAQGKESSRFIKDERFRENIANLIYCGIMIFIAGKAFFSHPQEAAAELAKQTGGLLSVGQITSLASNIKTANTLKDAIESTMEAI